MVYCALGGRKSKKFEEKGGRGVAKESYHIKKAFMRLASFSTFPLNQRSLSFNETNAKNIIILAMENLFHLAVASASLNYEEIWYHSVEAISLRRE